MKTAFQAEHLRATGARRSRRFGASALRPEGRAAWLVCLLAAFATGAVAADWSEDFSGDPLARGWRVAGDASLFVWDPTNQVLAVTWDSSRTNSYFLKSLDTVLTKADDFRFSFDLRLSDVAIGVNPNRPYTFQLAVGLVRRASVTDTNFQRGSGINAERGPRNLAEFTWFPNSGPGATVSPSILSSNNQPRFGFSFPLELDPGAAFHVEMSYTAADQILRTTMTRNGAAFGPIANVALGASFSDFRLDHFAVSSYSDAGAEGSILAHSIVDNLAVTVSPPAIAEPETVFANGTWTTTITSRTGFVYELERSTNLAAWTTVAGPAPGTGGALVLPDNSPPPAGAFYRVKADKP